MNKIINNVFLPPLMRLVHRSLRSFLLVSFLGNCIIIRSRMTLINQILFLPARLDNLLFRAKDTQSMAQRKLPERYERQVLAEFLFLQSAVSKATREAYRKGRTSNSRTIALNVTMAEGSIELSEEKSRMRYLKLCSVVGLQSGSLRRLISSVRLMPSVSQSVTLKAAREAKFSAPQ
uniref:Uncharacterized protein n=1 Tax=Anopheles atroparvus TaxID=41427 RepID=A0A182IV52_ANOAO